MRIIMGLAIIFMQFGLIPAAQAMTSEQLVDQCKRSQAKLPEGASQQDAVKKLLDTGSCVGFVGGAVSGINVVGSLMKQQGVIKKDLICLPPNTKGPQLVGQFMKHIEANPKEKPLPAQLGIYRYFVSSYPCKE